jgi:hypothetical protein
MNIAHQTPLENKTPARNFSDTLEQEAGELEALHSGLRRHLTAWRSAHESASQGLGAVMARIDAVLERAEHTRR